MRVLLFTGKGGAGKTTVAAATALHAARSGARTLLVSTDDTPSLSDCLDRPVGSEPVELQSDLTAGLSVVRVDVRARARRSRGTIDDHVLGILDTVGVDPVAAEELTVVPGAEEVLALLEIRDLVAGGHHDLVIVDCAPPPQILRLLALPEAFAHCLGQALPVERRVLRALAAGSHPGRPARDHLVDAAERLRTELDGVRAALTAPTTSVRVVCTPEAMAVAETRRLFTALALHGYPVDGVVANRLVPGHGDDPWRRAHAREQARWLAECETSFAPVPVLRAPSVVPEPVGLSALVEFGACLYGPPAESLVGAESLPPAESLVGASRPGGNVIGLLAPPPAESRGRVERVEDGFVLVLPLPLAGRDDVELARIGDDLSLEVAGRRRMLPLPSALRRCVVAGAGLSDGELRVRFRPDPALWRSP